MSEIGYTLGNPKGYDPAIVAARQKQEPLLKSGRTEDYSGGIVFRTPEEAKVYASENDLPYEPYGIMLPHNWETDVDCSRILEDYNCLLVDAEIVTLEEVKQIELLAL